jgi:hypothetical protein
MPASRGQSCAVVAQRLLPSLANEGTVGTGSMSLPARHYMIVTKALAAAAIVCFSFTTPSLTDLFSLTRRILRTDSFRTCFRTWGLLVIIAKTLAELNSRFAQTSLVRSSVLQSFIFRVSSLCHSSQLAVTYENTDWDGAERRPCFRRDLIHYKCLTRTARIAILETN